MATKKPDKPPAERETRRIPTKKPPGTMTAGEVDAVLTVPGSPAAERTARAFEAAAADPSRAYVAQEAPPGPVLTPPRAVGISAEWWDRLGKLAALAGVERDHYVELLVRKAWVSQDRQQRGTV